MIVEIPDCVVVFFLEFMKAAYEQDEEGKVRGSNDVLHTFGCSGDYGCCATTFDLSDITDAIVESMTPEEIDEHRELVAGHL